MKSRPPLGYILYKREIAGMVRIESPRREVVLTTRIYNANALSIERFLFHNAVSTAPQTDASTVGIFD